MEIKHKYNQVCQDACEQCNINTMNHRNLTIQKDVHYLPHSVNCTYKQHHVREEAVQRLYEE